MVSASVRYTLMQYERIVQVAELATRFFSFPFHIAAPFLRRAPPTSSAPFPILAPLFPPMYINPGVNDLRRKRHTEEMKKTHTLSTTRKTSSFFLNILSESIYFSCPRAHTCICKEINYSKESFHSCDSHIYFL